MSVLDGVMVHRVGDGLPYRKVFLDGVLVESVIMADIEHGIVECYPTPIVLDEHGDCQTHTLHGVVTVEIA